MPPPRHTLSWHIHGLHFGNLTLVACFNENVSLEDLLNNVKQPTYDRLTPEIIFQSVTLTCLYKYFDVGFLLLVYKF